MIEADKDVQCIYAQLQCIVFALAAESAKGNYCSAE